MPHSGADQLADGFLKVFNAEFVRVTLKSNDLSYQIAEKVFRTNDIPQMVK